MYCLAKDYIYCIFVLCIPLKQMMWFPDNLVELCQASIFSKQYNAITISLINSKQMNITLQYSQVRYKKMIFKQY